MVIRRAVLSLLVLLPLLVLGPAAPAGAAEGDGWAVEPSGPDGPGLRPNFAYNLEPGTTIRDTVSISNLTDEEITFNIYPKDAYNTPRDAAFALQADEEEPVGVGSWITMGTGEYVLAPRTRVDVPFELSIPENAEPGDHAGGIIAANAEPLGFLEDEGLNVQVRQRVGARVYVRVSGPLEPALRVERIDRSWSMPIVPWVTGRGDAVVAYEVRNVGNVRLEGVAHLKVSGVLGRTVKSFAPRELPELLPGASVVLTQSWSGLPPVEPLTASVEVTVDDRVVVSRGQGFFVWSWAALVIVVLVLGRVAWALWRRYRGRRAEVPEADVEHGPRPAHRRTAPADRRADSDGTDADDGADVPVPELEPESEPAHVSVGATGDDPGPDPAARP